MPAPLVFVEMRVALVLVKELLCLFGDLPDVGKTPGHGRVLFGVATIWPAAAAGAGARAIGRSGSYCAAIEQRIDS